MKTALQTWATGILLMNIAGLGCSPPAETPPPAVDPGALIQMDLTSKVGVLLDEIPEGASRDAVVAEILAENDTFWMERAARQTDLTYYRLIFRKYFYDPGTRNALPLPDRKLWKISLAGKPTRVQVDGHDIIVVDYSFQTHLLTDIASPKMADPALDEIGGTTVETFTLPVDPELLFERTRHACMAEAAYPLHSVFEENVRYFYADICGVEIPGMEVCHFTEFPQESCVEALQNHTGAVTTDMKFTRIAWNSGIADSVRLGEFTVAQGTALSVEQEEMAEENAIFYRYIEPGACEIEEQVVQGPGWRRLLAFSARVANRGPDPMDVGDTLDPASPYRKANVYEFSQCHQHVHFSHYANFNYMGAPGSKRAFCVEDTDRIFNNESTPLIPQHQSCQFQGMTQGWGDDYQFGIPGQWVDITNVDTTTPKDLTFELNPDGFLCEGKPMLDTSGAPIFEPTEFTNSEGQMLSRMKCDSPADWKSDNLGKISVMSEGGSFVNEPCARGQIGPLRSCGFDRNTTLKDCVPGATVTLQCTATGGDRVVRICERSEALGGIACTVGDAITNNIVNSSASNITFTCPTIRDATMPSGGYAIYGAPLRPSQSGSTVDCTGG